MNRLLELVEVSSGYGRSPVLRKVSLEVGAGEIVALVGANGAGKTTLLNTIMGIVSLGGGDIRFDGRSLSSLPTAAIVKSGIAIVPERRRLFGTMTVEENLRMGAYLSADKGSVSSLIDAQFAAFPILRERRNQAAQTMSGGEQQMLAIGRAMMSRPRLLLLDEPSLGLAPLMVERIMNQIQDLRRQGGTVLVVEQNARAALGIADRAYVLESGQVMKSGMASDLLSDPDVQDAYLGGQGAINQIVENRIRAAKATILGR